MERSNYPAQQVRPVSQHVQPGVHQYFQPQPERQTQPVYHYSGQPQQFRR